MAHCRCICGIEKDVYKSNLVSGRTKSCGCLEYENRHKYKDISNQYFGQLIALRPTKERKDGTVVWICQCSCGNTTKKSAHTLLRGDVKSCGCLRKKIQDAENKQYGQLMALTPLDNKLSWKTLWECQCQCGNICTVTFSNLYFGHTKSCGCLKNQEYRTVIEGTVVECLKSKIPKNNTSGVKGVYFYRGKWVAYITFRRVHHYLGSFDSIAKASIARKKAEEKYFGPLLKKYNEPKNSSLEKFFLKKGEQNEKQ